MAATNFTPIQLYHSTTAAAVPVNTNLVNGELAINITDGKLYYKDNGGTVRVIATKATGTIGGSDTQVQYNSSGALAGSSNFTFNGTTATINTLNLTNALGATYGGTAQSSWTTGDLLYASGSNTLAKLGIGLNTYILTSNGSIPGWAAPSAISVNTATNLAGGAAGSVPYQSGAGATTFLSIGTANQVITSSGSAPQWSSGLSITTLTASDAVTFSATTQNIALGTSQTSGTFTAGGAAQTGTQTVGQSTKTHTLNIGTGATESGATKTINIGTGGVSTSTTAITIGSANGTTITVNGTVNASTLDLTNLEVTNIKAKDGTASMTLADTTGIVTFSKATAIETTDNTNAALRVTQLGTGNAILVEDSANPDSSPFVVTAAGDVGIGAAVPDRRLVVRETEATAVSNTSFWNVAYGGARVDNLSNTTNTVTGIGFYGGAAATSISGIGNILESTSLGALGFFTGGSGRSNTVPERMRIDSSGNLGLGVTPSAWGSGYAALQIKQTALYTTATEVELGSNHFVNSSGQFAYIGNGFATRYEQYLGAHSWHTAPNNTSGAGFAPISFTQAMTLDALGNLLVGNTSDPIGSNRMLVQSAGTAGNNRTFTVYNTAATSTTAFANRIALLSSLGNGADVTIQFTDSVANNAYIGMGGGALYFATGGTTERARITSGGTFQTSLDASIYGVTVGRGSGGVSTNTVVGYQAGNGNTTGARNLFQGYQAAYYNTTGDDNTALGYGAYGWNTGAVNATGSFNTAVGSQALAANTSASSNTAVGYQAGYTNSTGAANTFVGRQAGYSATGTANTFVGQTAGYYSTGSYNTFVGTGSTNAAGDAVTTGSKNTILGGYGGNQGGLDIRTASNYIVLSDGDGNPRIVNDGTKTSTPTIALSASSSADTGSFAQIRVADGATSSSDARLLLGNSNGAYANLRIVSNSTSNLALDSVAGNNTSSPLNLLLNTNGGKIGMGLGSINSNGGVLQLASGITFPATQSASSDANTLDDYEEGDFSTSVAISGSTTAGTGTYTIKTAFYTKIGNVVHYQIYINWTAHTGTGNMLITGLPFTSRGGSSYAGSTIGYMYNIALTASNVPTFYVLQNSTTIECYQFPVGGGAATAIALDTAGEFICSGTYIVA